MPKTLAFDVYGTLINTHGVVAKLSEIVGDKAQAFSQTWRDKQLEYFFRRGLMQQYQNFSVVTRQALDYACLFYKEPLSDQQKDELLDVYRRLPAFDDVQQGLADLKAQGHQLYAFSNGLAEDVDGLLSHAGIDQYFTGTVSVDDLKTFKPNPQVYQYCVEQTDSSKDNTWLVSSNPFDVIGAVSSGLHAAWVQRSTASHFDPWGIEPDAVVASLCDLAELEQLK